MQGVGGAAVGGYRRGPPIKKMGVPREAFKSKKVQNFVFDQTGGGGGGVWTIPLKTKPIFLNVQIMDHWRQSKACV